MKPPIRSWRTLLVLAGGVALIGAGLFAGLKLLPQPGTPGRIGTDLTHYSFWAQPGVLADLNGRPVRLSDYGGKVVLINAWAIWCPPCRDEMPLLNRYYLAHHSTNFVLLAIDAGDAQDETARYASQMGLTFPVLLDPHVLFMRTLGINSYPTSLLVGPEGKIKAIHAGAFTREALETEITPLLAQP